MLYNVSILPFPCTRTFYSSNFFVPHTIQPPTMIRGIKQLPLPTSLKWNAPTHPHCAISICQHKTRPKKPPFTYTELIEYALEDKGELTVSGIYQWIS